MYVGHACRCFSLYLAPPSRLSLSPCLVLFFHSVSLTRSCLWCGHSTLSTSPVCLASMCHSTNNPTHMRWPRCPTQQCHRLCATCMVAARQHLPQQQQHAARSQQQQQLQLQQTQAVCPPECPFFGVTPPTQPPTRSSSSCSRKGPAAALPG